MTTAEHALWYRLRDRQLHGHRFRRQVPIGLYIADFACLPVKLVIEVDGAQHVDDMAHDARREAFLASRGYRVLRFWNGDVLGRTDDVLEAIARALPGDPHPNPPPSGGRETGEGSSSS